MSKSANRLFGTNRLISVCYHIMNNSSWKLPMWYPLYTWPQGRHSVLHKIWLVAAGAQQEKDEPSLSCRGVGYLIARTTLGIKYTQKHNHFIIFAVTDNEGTAYYLSLHIVQVGYACLHIGLRVCAPHSGVVVRLYYCKWTNCWLVIIIVIYVDDDLGTASSATYEPTYRQFGTSSDSVLNSVPVVTMTDRQRGHLRYIIRRRLHRDFCMLPPLRVYVCSSYTTKCLLISIHIWSLHRQAFLPYFCGTFLGFSYSLLSIFASLRRLTRKCHCLRLCASAMLRYHRRKTIPAPIL